MPKKSEMLTAKGAQSGQSGEARSVSPRGSADSDNGRMQRASPISKRIIQETSVRRRTAMKVLADL